MDSRRARRRRAPSTGLSLNTQLVVNLLSKGLWVGLSLTSLRMRLASIYTGASPRDVSPVKNALVAFFAGAAEPVVLRDAPRDGIPQHRKVLALPRRDGPAIAVGSNGNSVSAAHGVALRPSPGPAEDAEPPRPAPQERPPHRRRAALVEGHVDSQRRVVGRRPPAIDEVRLENCGAET